MQYRARGEVRTSIVLPAELHARIALAIKNSGSEKSISAIVVKALRQYFATNDSDQVM